MFCQFGRKGRRRGQSQFEGRIDPFRKAIHSLERLELRVLLSADAALALTLSPTSIAENAGTGAVTGTITRSNMDTTQAITVNLTSGDTSHATVVSTATIQAGAASATFSVSPLDDNLVDADHAVKITGYAPSPISVGLDSTFNNSGYLSVPLSATSSADLPGIGVQADGKIVAVASPALGTSGTWAVTRALPNGSPDTTFGSGGTVVTAFPGSTGGTANSIAFQSDGKILVAGIVLGTNQYDTWGVARYNTDGSLDGSFGSGGMYQFSFNSTNGYGGWAYSVAEQPDGKILVGGELRGTGMGFSVGRLTSGGQLDTSFGSGGIASLDVDPSSNYNETGQSMYLEPDGHILMTGIANYNYLAVARFTSTGAADTGFNGNGVRLIPYLAFGSAYNSIVGYAVTAQPDGKIIVTGTARNTSTFNYDFATARLNTDGSLDTTFNGTGLSTVSFGNQDTAYSVVVQADGKILLGGQVGSGGLALARYNPNGTLDATFNGGKLTVTPPDPFEALWDIALQSDGKLVGIAEGAGTNGSYSQLYRFDTGLLTASASVNVTNTDGVGPTAANDAFAMSENDTLTVAAPGVLGNDTAINSTPLSAGLISGPSHGSLTLNSDGSFTYQPTTGFYGIDRFTYDDLEGSLTSSAATVTITVKAPVAADDSYIAEENTTLSVAAPGVLGNDSAVNGSPLSSVLVSGPRNGILTLNSDGSFAYTPATDFYGTDSFTYDDREGNLSSNTATVRIAINAPPTAVNDSYLVNGSTGLTTASPGILANDSDPDGDKLTATLASGPSHGSLTLSSSGFFSYKPNINYSGSDTFTYQASDGPANSNIATVSLNVDQPPVAQSASVSTNENSPAAVQLTATDAETPATQLAFTLTQLPAHGTLTDGSGHTVAAGATFTDPVSLTYTPSANYSGSDGFTYQASDGQFYSNLATVSLTVNAVPIAVDDSYSTNENSQLVANAPAVTSLSMVSQTGDYIGQGKTYNFTPATGSFSVSSPYNNELVFNYQQPNEWWSLTFVAPYGKPLVPGAYNNATRAPFQAASDPGLDVSGDGRGSNTLTGSFVVSQAVYDATGKVISFDATFVQHSEGATPALTGEIKYNVTSGIGGVLTNDVPASSTPLSSAIVSGPSHGTVSLNTDGTFTYTPAAYFFGTDSFTYDDTEGSVTSNIATAAIAVNFVNQAPSFSEGPNPSIAQGAGAQTVANWATNISAGPPDESAQVLTFQVSTSDDALFSVLPAIDPATGTLTYTPAPGAVGSATVSVLLHDNGGTANGGVDTSPPQTFTITVNNVPPTVNLGGNVTVNEGDTMSAAGSFTDPGADTWTATVDYGDGVGPQSLPLNADKTFSLSHAYADNGSYTVTVAVSDSNGGAGTSSFVVTVDDVAPTAAFTNNGPIDEGGVVKVSFGAPFDPSSVDTGAGFRYSISTTAAGLAASFDAAGPSPWATILFDDNGNDTVYGRVFDKDNGYTDYSTTVTVNNVAPTASLAAAATAPEGTTVGIVVLNLQSDPSRADTNAGFHYAFAFNDSSSFDSGDGTYDGSGTSNVGSIPASVLADGPAVVTIRARIIDKDGGYTDYSTTMDVLNVAPTATISAPLSVSEGTTTATVALTGPLDPSPIDTAAGFHYAFDFNDDGTFDLGDGTYTGSAGAAAATIPESYLDDGAGTLTVRARILDKDGGYSDYTSTIGINNVAPTATLLAPVSVNEGGSATVALSNAADPSQADTNADFHYAFRFSAGGTTVSLGDGTYGGSLASSAASVPASMLGDGSATVTVQAWVVDKDNAATEYSTTIVVNNVAPTATIVEPPPTNEGTTAVVSLLNPVDPSQADFDAGFHYSFALNRSSLSTSYAAASVADSAPLPFDDNGNVTVYGRIFDKDGGYTDYSTAVTVLNVAPTATFSNNGPIDEGGVVKVSFSNPADPSTADTGAGFHYSISTTADGLAGSYDAAGPSPWATMLFADNGSYTVYGRVFDKDNGYTDYATVVTVNNVAPTATFYAPASVPEAGAALVALDSPFDPSSADTSAGLHYAFAFNDSASFDLGDGTYSGSGTSNVVSVPDNLLADGPATIAVRARVIDKDGGYTDYTATVTVTNVAPTATMLAPASVTEGSSMVATVTLSAWDPSTVDRSIGLHYAYDFNNDGAFDLGDGTYAGSTAAHSSVIPEQFMDEGPGQLTVRERVIDKNGGYNDYTATILITNVAPTATLSNGGAVNEGSPATVSLTNASDPSTADMQAGLHYSFATSTASLAATYTAAGTAASSQITFDETGSYTVYGRIFDKDNGFTDYTTVVTVNDVAPTAVLSNSGPVSEGSPVTLSFANSYSPSPSDTAAGFRYSFALAPAGLATSYTGASTSSSHLLTFNDNGSYTVYGRILDHDGAYSDYSTVVVVNNVAPTATLSNGGAVNEGSPVTVSFTNASDASAADMQAGLHYSFATSAAGLAASYADAGTAVSSQFTFDAVGSYTVYGRIFDKDNGHTDYTTVVAVNGAPPTASVSGPNDSVRGQPQAFTFTANDPAGQTTTFTYAVDWGDGLQQSFPGAATMQQVHAYSGTGSYHVTVSVTDDGGSQRSLPASWSLTVFAATLEGADLDIGSTTGSDMIMIAPSDLKGDLQVTINGASQGTFHPTGEIVVYSQGVGDQIKVQTARFGHTTAYVSVPAVLFGGAGNDTIDARGSTANNVLVGSIGNDTLYGGTGRNVLIGGAASDTLYAGSADDVLIAGTTDYDKNLAALNAIMREWGSSDSFQTRMNDLLGPTGRQNGSFFLNPGTVHDDAAVDYLYGGKGQDWFFYESSKPFADILKNIRGGDTVTDIGGASASVVEPSQHGRH